MGVASPSHSPAQIDVDTNRRPGERLGTSQWTTVCVKLSFTGSGLVAGHAWDE